MSPADECRAFQHFLAGNDDIDGVAKRFGVTRRFVEGRLRLAKLAEPIFAALASGKITLDIAKAYASTESHDKQLLVWGQYGASSYASADSIRRVIANEAMSSTDPVALLVGADAYVAAGGVIDRDLFSDSADRWLAPEIAQNLAAAIMEAEAKRIGDEQGLAWIRPIAGTSTWEAARNLFRVQLPEAPMDETDIARMDAIAERLETLEAEMENEDLSEDAYTALADEVEALESERLQIGRRGRIMPAELASRVGTFLTLIPILTDYDPHAHSRYPMDLMRPGSSRSLFQAEQQ
jgi:ParB family chromosome partitioning protein